MTDVTLYAVFIHPGALEALGDAIAPYLTDGPHGKHVICREIDSGGAFFEMLLEGTTGEGKPVELELMIPSNMVQMVVSTHSDGVFGFHHHGRELAEPMKPRRKVSAVAKAPSAAPAIEPAVAGNPMPPVEG